MDLWKSNSKATGLTNYTNNEIEEECFDVLIETTNPPNEPGESDQSLEPNKQADVDLKCSKESDLSSS